MKDEHDKSTADFIQAANKAHWHKPTPKSARGDRLDRIVREETPEKVPALAKVKTPVGVFAKCFVPVSFAAKDWDVTPRRIRSLLVANRLEGRRQDNGYWEVAYPYRYEEGTRGPRLRRSQSSKKLELRVV